MSSGHTSSNKYDYSRTARYKHLMKLTRDYGLHFSWVLQTLDRLCEEFPEDEAQEYLKRYLTGELQRDISNKEER